jgi:tubulin polyglutamylase TTLL6/13
VLGVDILLDHKLKPWLLEINSRPSFRTDTPLDKKIKNGVIYDSLKLINVQPQNKYKYMQKQKLLFKQRVFKGRQKKDPKKQEIQ